MRSLHIAERQIIDPASGEVLYEPGDAVSDDDAIRFGLTKRRARRPARDTARRHENDRAIDSSEDR